MEAARLLQQQGWIVSPVPCDSDVARAAHADSPSCVLRPFGGPEWRDEPFDENGRSTAFYAWIERGPTKAVISAFEESGILAVTHGQIAEMEIAIFMSATLSRRVARGELSRDQAKAIAWRPRPAPIS